MAGAKKKVVENLEEQEQKAPASEPVAAGDVVFVNREKFERAKEIVALVSGLKAPINDQEADRKEHYARHFAAKDVNPKGKDAVQFAYELLGGLVRSPEEQEAADEKAAEARSKNKKRAIQGDDSK